MSRILREFNSDSFSIVSENRNARNTFLEKQKFKVSIKNFQFILDQTKLLRVTLRIGHATGWSLENTLTVPCILRTKC